MKLFLTTALLSFGVTVHSAAAGSGCPNCQPVHVVSQVEVPGGEIRLAQLLPADAPQALRELARSVVISAAPQPGMVRRIAAGEISPLLERLGELKRQIVLPAAVEVSRRSRFITGAEVIAALPGEQPEEITAASVRVPQVPIAADETIAVSGVRYAASSRQSIVRLGTVSPANGRFTGTALLAIIPGQVSWRDGHGGRQAEDPAHSPGEASAPPPAAAPLDVLAGQLAMAVLELPGIRISQAVLPLRNGRLGETIAVRAASDGRTLRAVVTAPSQLKLLADDSPPRRPHAGLKKESR